MQEYVQDKYRRQINKEVKIFKTTPGGTEMVLEYPNGNCLGSLEMVGKLLPAHDVKSLENRPAMPAWRNGNAFDCMSQYQNCRKIKLLIYLP